MLRERIDVHSHYFPPAYRRMLKRHGLDMPDGVKAPDWSLDRQWEYMEQLHVSFAALSLSSPHLHQGDMVEAIETARSCNEYGADLAEKYPDRFGVLASLPLPETDASIQEIRYCREVLNIHGFALLTNYHGIYLGSERLEPVMEELNRQKTLITIHPTLPKECVTGVVEELPGPVMEYFFETTRTVVNLLLKGTIRRYQNLRFVVPHGGAFLTILSDRLIPLAGMLLQGRKLEISGDLAQLYYDLAGFSMPKQYDLLRTMTDDSHLLYGSDSPFTALPVCRKQAEQMAEKMDGAMEEQVCRQNAGILFREVGLLK